MARKRSRGIRGAVLQLSISTLDQGQDKILVPLKRRDFHESKVKISENKRPCDIVVKVDENTGLIERIYISYLNGTQGTLEKVECSCP